MSRKNGDGSFRKLPSGSIEFAVSVGVDSYGKHQRERFYGKTQSECRKKYKDFIKGGEKQSNKAKTYTLSDWLYEWLRVYKMNKVEPSTYKDYLYLAAHVKRHKIGSMKLPQVKSLHITEFFTSIIMYSYSFRKRMQFLLGSAFECAIDNDYCEKNPVRRAEIAKKVQPEKEEFSEGDTKIILDFAKTDEFFGVPMYILLNTGIRSQEMRALEVEQFDFERGITKIDKAVKRTGKLGLPKNGKKRVVPLELEVNEFLKAKLSGKSGFIIGGDNYVTHSGFRGRYECFFKRLNRFLESKGEKPIKIKSPHATRHTFGTLRQKNGMPPAIVMRLLGHSSLAMTGKYTHFSDIATLTDAVRKHTYLN